MGLGNAARRKLTAMGQSAIGLGAKHVYHATAYGARSAFVKDVDKTIINPLGKKLGGLGALGVTAGAVAWGIGTGTYVEGRAKTLSENADYVGNVGAMDYDGVANVDRRTGQRDFGATGDLVFGLNRGRKG